MRSSAALSIWSVSPAANSVGAAGAWDFPPTTGFSQNRINWTVSLPVSGSRRSSVERPRAILYWVSVVSPSSSLKLSLRRSPVSEYVLPSLGQALQPETTGRGVKQKNPITPRVFSVDSLTARMQGVLMPGRYSSTSLPLSFRTAPEQLLHACLSWATLHDLLLRFPAASLQNRYLHRFLCQGGTHGSNRKQRCFADGYWNREEELRCDPGRRLRRSGKEGRCRSVSGKRDAWPEHPWRASARGGRALLSLRGFQSDQRSSARADRRLASRAQAACNQPTDLLGEPELASPAGRYPA